MPHQVEVDDEVFAFVKSRAEPFVDTFNSALRKLLPLPDKVPERKPTPIPAPIASKAWEGMPTFPGGTPEALRQIIEVVLLVRGKAHDRVSATKIVADRHKIAITTVQDKYARQLRLNTQQFDRLLDQSDLNELKRRLQSKFNSNADLIERLL